LVEEISLIVKVKNKILVYYHPIDLRIDLLIFYMYRWCIFSYFNHLYQSQILCIEKAPMNDHVDCIIPILALK
jgi:hypothetical protein